MNLVEEINKKRLLPQPTTSTDFEDIEDSDGGNSSSTWSSSKSERSNKIRSKNPDLYLLHDTGNPVERVSYDESVDENDIIVSVIETNGGDCSKLKDEERWQKYTQENKEKTDVNVRCQAEGAQSLEVPLKNKKIKFKKNVLMRELVKKIDRGEIPQEVTTKINGKVEENCNHVNGGQLVQSIDDPDFFYLRNTSIMNSYDEDDGFRFEHRGVKKKVTPRDYALNEIPDECFKFQRKSE